MKRVFYFCAFITFWILVSSGQASLIGTEDIVVIPQHLIGSGNGTLDLRMFTYSGSEIDNKVKDTFNGDNGNNTLPQGNGAPSFFNESYVTTAGELKAYFNMNFPTTAIHEIVLFLDLNETGSGTQTNTLVKLDVILNPASIAGNPNPLGDVSSSQQGAINQGYTGGTKIASLSPEPAANLPVNSQGAGFADWAIYTGIDPFSLNDNDVLLFNIGMDNLNDGSEEIFLSGKYAPTDLPEPATIGLVSFSALAFLRRKNS